MLDLDGSDGGGQLVRSALTCSLATGEAFDLTGIRGERPDSGLSHQHLAAVEFAADLGEATVEGAELGSEHLRFEPGDVRAGIYDLDIGTAGSVTLLCDVAVPLSARLDAPLRVTVTGGTDVKWSPPVDYLRRVKLPMLRASGWGAALDVGRRGFYPVGGGEVTLSLHPCEPSPLDLTARGDRTGARVYAVESIDLADADVGQRLARTTVEGLEADGWDVVERRVTTADADSPGAAVVARLDYDGGVAGVSGLGEKGVPAEEVAEAAVEAAAAFEAGSGAVDAHLADQLVVPVALAGGRVAIPTVTRHVETNVDLVRAFGLDVSIDDGPTISGT
ncbi:RNA 3'-terminal phosphate cyclase [Halorarius halobius]|uniref:RNA 3'-terminal phosphate cyclase n=1 Tax=Halorarius halobius TaxID=2962671 RepID=UPI0020CC8590|nr:RNA 3'-terminal phosphate cyclase [Halorarius halobius]